MAGGPLHWFRKNQKILLVVFGVLLMIVFTVGGVLDSFFSGQNQNGSPVRQVATTSFGNFTNRDMDEFAEANRRVAEFTFELYRLSGDPTKAKAVPISPLNASTTEARDRDILSRLAFAKFAEENGIFVGEEIIDNYFNMLCNNELANVGKTVEQFSRELQRGSLTTVKSHLKTELMSRCGQQMLSSGVNPQFSQQGFLVGVSPTPVEVWEGHRRLREKFKIQYMSFDVDSADSISEEPSADEMKALYEEGSDRAPNIAFGPGFKSPRLATVGYFAINRKAFLDAEKLKISEAEVQTKYQEWVDNEDFRVIESDALPGSGGAFVPNPNVSEENASKDKNEDPKNSDTEAPKLNAPNNNQKYGDGKNSPEKGVGSEGKNEPAKSKANDSKSSPKNSKTEDENANPKTEKKEAPKSPQQSRSNTNQPFQYVSLIQEKDGKKQDDPAKKAADPAGASKQVESPKKNDTTNDKKQSPAKSGESESKQSPEKSEANSDQEKKSTTPDPVPPKAVQEDKDKDKPKIKPLDDELRETIKEDLARPKATAAIDKAIEEVKAVVTDYLNDYDYYSENPDEKEYLQVPDFEEIAGKYGLMFKEYTQVDYQTLRKTDFGKANVATTDARRQPGRVAEEVFFATFQSGSNFEIFTTRPVDDVEYMFWITDKKYRSKVDFADAKPQIIEYFKTMKAVEAAEEKARKIASDVADQNKTLLAVYGDEVTTSREFGWMEIDEAMENMAMNNPQFIQQMPQFFTPKMGQIFPEEPEDAKALEGIGHQFMAKVFQLEENEIGYAVNAEKDKVYVFQVMQRTKPNPIQKDQFFSQFKFDMARQTSQLDHGRALNQILSAEDLLEKYAVKWFGEVENK